MKIYKNNKMSNFESPVPLSDIESVLAWVDTYKLSRPTKKINRDFSDAGTPRAKLKYSSEFHNFIYDFAGGCAEVSQYFLNIPELLKIKTPVRNNSAEDLCDETEESFIALFFYKTNRLQYEQNLNAPLKLVASVAQTIIRLIHTMVSAQLLLAEILSVHYPKLVDMHNYPPRNSHSLKLNNWLTLNRKVLRKLKLNLCTNTMEQLANCTSGVVERVLIMVRDKIRRDDEVNRSMREMDQNLSSGGSYYEACGDDDNVLVVPLKTRVNGVLEVIQKKVVSHESYLTLKEELRDISDTADTLKQKVEHLENLLKLKEERIEELHKQLERKQARRKEVEALQNSLAIPFEEPPAPDISEVTSVPSKPLIVKSIESVKAKEESKIPIPIDVRVLKPNIINSEEVKVPKLIDPKMLKPNITKSEEAKISIPIENKIFKPNIPEVISKDIDGKLDKVKSDIFKEVEVIDERNLKIKDDFHDTEDRKEVKNMTIEDSIEKEIHDIYQTNFVLHLQSKE